MPSLRRPMLVFLFLLLALETETAFNSGRNHILLYPEFRGTNGSAETGAYVISQTTSFNLTVSQSGSPSNLALNASNNFEVFTANNIISGSGIFPNMVVVSSDVDVTIFGVSHTSNRGEIYSSIPVSGLGIDHYIVTYCVVTNQPCQIDIACVSATTEVDVTLPNGPNSVSVGFMGQTYTNGETFRINLGPNQVAQIQSQSDLTGTRVLANLNVAVFSGSSGTSIQGNNEGFLLKPMPPVKTWGKEYIAVPTPGRTKTGDYFRIITSEKDTLVAVSGESPVSIPSAGQWIQRNFSNGVTKRISSNKPVMVVRLSVSERESDEPGFPTMLVIIPNEQFVKGVDVVVPRIAATTSNVITVVTKTSNTAGMASEGNTITNWVTVEGSVYETAEVTVNLDYNNISSTDPQAEFAVYFYGHGTMSNAYISGRNYANINPPCAPTIMSIGDEVDNDCDGMIDEDTCAPNDVAGKDCAVIIIGERDVYGNEFVFAFPYHRPKALAHIFLMSPTSGVTVILEEPNGAGVLDTKVLTGNNSHFYNFTSSQQIQPSNLSNKTLRLTASDEITAYALSSDVMDSLSGGAFRLLPTESLGREYMTVTYCERNNCFIVISAAHPDTEVKLFLNLHSPVSITYGGMTYYHGDTIRIGLVQFESAQILGMADMTGSKITSNKPVSVISGGQFTSVKEGTREDLVIESLVPIQALGHHAAVVQTPGRLTHMFCSTCRDYLRVVATEDATSFTLTMNGSSSGYSLDFQGMFQDIELIDKGILDSEKPVLIVQLLTSGPAGYDGGMVSVVPVEQFSNMDNILIPAGMDFNQTDSDLYLTSMLVIANQTDTANILLDLNTFASWGNMPGLMLATASRTITKGDRALLGTANSIIGGHVSANMQQFAPGSFIFPLAFKLLSINKPCMLSPSVPGDQIDNDCDGYVDEENCSNPAVVKDEDYDGMFDEDCQYNPVDSSIVPTSTAVYETASEFPSSSEASSVEEYPSPILSIDDSTPSSVQLSTLTPSHVSTEAQDTSNADTTSFLSSVQGAISSSSLVSEFSPRSSSLVADLIPFCSVTPSLSSSSRPQLTASTPILASSVPETSTSTEPSKTVAESLIPSQSSDTAVSQPESTAVPAAATTHSCTCICSSLSILDQGSLTEVVASIRKELIVDKDTISQTIRKKTSAPDDRPSAVSMGYVGVAVISSLFVGIFVLDAGSLFRDIVSLLKSMRDACK